MKGRNQSDRNCYYRETLSTSHQIRSLLIEPNSHSIKLTRFTKSKQSSDLSEAPNCDGFGRIHHFNRYEGSDWPQNPLPIDPAIAALGLQNTRELRAQVFQSSGCNWNCWYCYVPIEDRTAQRGEFVQVSRMVDLYLAEQNKPVVVDLTGGQPDLTPEWIVWFVEEIMLREIESVYIWSDDNLSTDYFWRYLEPSQIALLGEYPRYGRACCLKGYDYDSFSFNTRSSPSDFDNQFMLLKRFLDDTKIDLYLYVTLTSPSLHKPQKAIRSFVDRLQMINETLPLRTIPLKILEWGPVTQCLNNKFRKALHNQFIAVEAWQDELERRFSLADLSTPIIYIPR